MTSDNQLVVTKEAVLEAAKQCPDAARILKALFPKAFEKPAPPPFHKDVKFEVTSWGWRLSKNGQTVMEAVGSNTLYLVGDSFDWELGELNDFGSRYLNRVVKK